EVEKLVQQFKSLKSQATYDSKTVTLTAQAMVGAKVEEKFDLTSEDIERAVVRYHEELATNKEFASVNMQMQKAMSYLMGAEKA
ncbi:SGR1, partial [Symbiodinium necroappetens]